MWLDSSVPSPPHYFTLFYTDVCYCRVSCLCSAWEAALQHGMKHSNKALATIKYVHPDLCEEFFLLWPVQTGCLKYGETRWKYKFVFWNHQMLSYCTGGRKVHANVNVFIGRTFELFNATCETTMILFNPFSNV